DAEPIIHGGALEQVDDLQIVARVGEGAGEQVFYLVAQFVEAGLRLGKSEPCEETLQLSQGKVARMRGVAQFLQPVERDRLCRILRRASVNDDDPSSRSAYPDHLPQDCARIKKMVE